VGDKYTLPVGKGGDGFFLERFLAGVGFGMKSLSVQLVTGAEVEVEGEHGGVDRAVAAIREPVRAAGEEAVRQSQV